MDIRRSSVPCPCMETWVASVTMDAAGATTRMRGMQPTLANGLEQLSRAAAMAGAIALTEHWRELSAVPKPLWPLPLTTRILAGDQVAHNVGAAQSAVLECAPPASCSPKSRRRRSIRS